MSNDAAATKFASFLKDKKIDKRRLLAASHKLESLQAADRTIRLAKRQARGVEDKKGPADTRESRSGRPVTPRSLGAPLANPPPSATVGEDLYKFPAV